ncbi:aminotransferase class V-fold PLP-dependent enzyme [Nocardia sp. NBC_00565]|uniref:aminotransferase class V-fold PLP-dependent enzyme n=1 Tax=Nocardia sp. NBC_00565 TaxID=2975993 RepID=UPI002E7FF525|nr:aminotransferase class V-fold PLP-dependent enzyme [Nocardia sp. NBC_00565]WUC05197.1 aminotransferase class V-fold PLP-dependent enzyme [Nocardia sp. NBC_00565]
MSSLAPDEFTTETTYLNTASYGLPSARALAALRAQHAEWASGRGGPMAHDHLVPELRAGYARLLEGASADDIALGATASTMIAPVAAALRPGAEVLLAEGEFSSVSMPFVYRGDLAVRFVPLERLAEEVRPETALVAVSVVQSKDGRITDLPVLRAATLANDARLLVDATQAASWLPLRFTDADYWVCSTFKWLIGARSVTFFAAAPEAAAELRPLGPGWYAAADRWAELYEPIALPTTARRFDTTPDWLGVIAAVAGLSLIEELTVDKIGAHNRELAAQFRTGLTELGFQPLPNDSAIVVVPGAGDAAPRLAEAGVIASARGGGLRFAFHLYNSTTDVDRALTVLADR